MLKKSNPSCNLPKVLSSTYPKPILKWAGGKAAALPKLLPLFPKTFNRYFEPFLGGGAVFFALGFNGESFLNDLNSEIINLYSMVRDYPILLMDELDDLRRLYSEEFYYELREQNSDSPLSQAARTLFLNKTGFNGLYRQNLKGEFNVPFGKRKQCPSLYDRENLLKVSQLLKYVTLQSVDFETTLDQAGQGDFVYCDPPYEPISPTASFNNYLHTGFSQNDQRRLKEACLRAQARGSTVVISNSSAPLIQEMYADCEINTILARRAINSKGDGRGRIEELVVVLSPLETN